MALVAGNTAHLWALVARQFWLKAGRRLRTGPVFRWRYSGRTPERVLIAPPDLRLADPQIALEIYYGRYPLAGHMVETGGQSPFQMEVASRGWQKSLHGFRWLRHMRAAGTDLAAANARALVGDWIALHGNRISGPAWEPGTTAKRIIAWLSHSPVVLKDADYPFYRRFLKSLAFQVRYLRHVAETTRDGEPRLRVRIALAMASIAMPASVSRMRKAAQHLDAELDRQILPDGGHCSRNPRAALDLLLDLLPLRQTYVNLGHDMPSQLIPCIDRIFPALRFFRHQGGELALFNGATYTLANELMSALRYDETGGAPFKALPSTSYHRLAVKETVVLMDTGLPRSVDLSATAAAGTLSIEMSSGKNRFIVNSGRPLFA
ncbi:MAG: heparinase II/III family protein, partial [Mesorhizobium sp.]|nr:heparinase II/III family protein [Mesorhizobium sp.]